MQQGQPARRAAEGVHPGDGLLAAVAALVEVHRRRPIQPTSLGIVRWSVSRPRRGSPRAIRSASKAHRPHAGPAASAYVGELGRAATTSYVPATVGELARGAGARRRPARR